MKTMFRKFPELLGMMFGLGDAVFRLIASLVFDPGEAQAFGALDVYAVDINADKLRLAAGYGALPVNARLGDPVAEIHRLTQGRGVDVALELIGLPQTMKQAVQSLAVMGRAVVATPAGGIPDALRDGENGRLVPINDAPALAETLDELLADAEQRARLGAQARVTAQHDFTPEQELARNLAIYAQIVEAA